MTPKPLPPDQIKTPRGIGINEAEGPASGIEERLRGLRADGLIKEWGTQNRRFLIVSRATFGPYTRKETAAWLDGCEAKRAEAELRRSSAERNECMTLLAWAVDWLIKCDEVPLYDEEPEHHAKFKAADELTESYVGRVTERMT